MSARSGGTPWNARTTADEALAGQNLTDRLIVITGGAGGIGLAAALAFARAGGDVAIAGRTSLKVDAASRMLENVARGGRIMKFHVDLMSQDSIARFGDQLRALDRPIDVFLANAGIIGPLERNREGIESGLMTSFVSHAILASDLREQLTQRPGSRFVTVSSFGHQFSPVVFEDINFELREYRPFASYGQSKTASIMLAVSLSNAWRAKGVDAFSLHPGTIVTEVTRSLRREDFREAKERGAVTAADQIKTLEQGAATSVWASTDPALCGRGPLYLEDCQIASVIDEPNFSSGVMRYALDLESASRLWSATESMIGRNLPL